MSSVVRGKDFKFYINTDEPYDSSPTWGLVSNIKDLSRSLEKALADASNRATSFRQQVGTMKELKVDFQMVYDPDDANLQIVEDAFFDDENKEVLMLDGSIDTIGSRGLRFMSQVVTFTTNENLEDVGTVDVSLVVGFDQDNLPRRVHVASPGSVVDS